MSNTSCTLRVARAPAYESLEVRFRQGQSPRLVMLDEAGEKLETVPIGGWTFDTIIEYLDDALSAA